jgi:hypothetical protein
VQLESLCARGEVVCWARRDRADGPWAEVPIESWAAGLRINDVGLLSRFERHDERVPMRHPATGRQVFVIEPRSRAVEVWCEPRFALADSSPPPRSPAWRRQVKDWFVSQYVPSLDGRVPSRDEVIADVKARWPGASDHLIRKLKSVYLPGKRGRRRL